MQTFLVDIDYNVSASYLCNARLVKQLVEGLQIAEQLIDYPLLNGDYKHRPHIYNHPVTKLWKDYRHSFCDYLTAISNELLNRGLAVDSAMHGAIYDYFIHVDHERKVSPKWVAWEFINSHREALLYKTSLKNDIYHFSCNTDIPLYRVKTHSSFIEQNSFRYKDLAKNYPEINNRNVASWRMCDSAAEVYANYYSSFQLFPEPLKINYIWS
jgi:hypothetical protein